MKPNARTGRDLAVILASALTLSAAAMALRPPKPVRHPPLMATAPTEIARPFPQHVAYVAGSIGPTHRSQAQLDADTLSYYRRWVSHYLVPAGLMAGGRPRYRVLIDRDPASRTVSEGMGYGMIAVAYMAGADPAARARFDGQYAFVQDHPSEIDPRLMDWSVPADESLDPNGNDSAFDGDCDIAYALLLASAQWGDGGRVDYAAEAAVRIAAIMDSTIGPNSSLPFLGDWGDSQGATYNEYTPRTSDFIIGHFRAFGRFSGDSRWDDVAAACSNAAGFVQATYSPATGLLPDFLVPVSPTDHTLQPAPPNFLEGPNDGDYSYNAARDPWRIGVDALLNGDAASWSQAAAIATWVHSVTLGDPNAIHAGYRLNGHPIPGSNFFSAAFVAPIAVASMLDPPLQTDLNTLYDAVRSSDDNYYEDSLALLSLIVMSGNWWDPTLP